MRARAVSSLPWLVGAAVAATVAVGLALEVALPARAFDSWLGVPWPPFFAFLRPQVSLAALPAAAALAAGVVIGAGLVRGGLGPARFASALTALALVERLALAAARGGTDAWTAPLSRGFEPVNEYLGALPALRGLGLPAFLDRFAELSPTLPLHASAHPPGMVVALDLFGVHGPGGNAALVIGAGVLAAPLTYALGRALAGERTARAAGVLFALSPAALIYGATSADALFCALATAAAAALVARRPRWRVLGPPLLALASFFSYALLAVGLFAVLAVARRDGARAALRLAAWSAAVVVVFYAALWALTGFDVVGSVRAADAAYRTGIYLVRPYWYWVLGSPAAFLVALGLPVAWLALRAAARRQAVAVAFLLTLAAAALLGFSKAETERIWLFLVPLACVAAAGALREDRLGVVLALLAAQALAVEVLMYTIW